MAYDITIIGFI